LQKDTGPIRLRMRSEFPLTAFLSIILFILGTLVLALSLTRILAPVEAFVVMGSSLLTLGITMLQQSSWVKPVPQAIVVTPASKSFKYKDKVFVSVLLRVEFQRYFLFLKRGPSFNHTALAMLYAYLHKDDNSVRYYINYTPFFANPWVTERGESRHVGWITTASIAYIHLIDVVLDPKSLAIESIAFRTPVSVIDIPYVYYEPEQLSEIIKRNIGEDMKDIEICRNTNIELVVLGSNIVTTSIYISLNNIITKLERAVSKDLRTFDKIYEIPIDP